MKHCLMLIFLGLVSFGCGDTPIPKPEAYLRLDYPQPEYKIVQIPLPFQFEKNTLAMPIGAIKISGKTTGIDLKYPKLKATIYLSYNEVNAENLDSLLRDAQTLTQKHTMKADEISSTVYDNSESNAYGMFYEVGGDAASQAQFYLTDSITHFLSGSLYFYAKPNYDSIYPASEYLKRDIKHLMETLKWRRPSP